MKKKGIVAAGPYIGKREDTWFDKPEFSRPRYDCGKGGWVTWEKPLAEPLPFAWIMGGSEVRDEASVVAPKFGKGGWVTWEHGLI